MKPAEPGAKIQRRRQGLAPFLQAIDGVIDAGTAESIPPADHGSNGPVVALDPWALNWIRSSLRVQSAPPELPEVLRQSLAFLVKCATDMSRLRREEPRAATEFFAIQAELMLDSAVGMALLLEIRKAVNDLVALGAVSDARMLTKLEGKLRGTVRELKQSIIESNRGRDDDLLQHFTDVAQAEAPVLDGSDSTLDEVPTPVQRRPPHTKRAAALERVASVASRPGLRTEVLLALVSVACIIWVALRASPTLGQRNGKLLSRDDFVASAAIREITARPPSAYVVVDAAAWTKLNEEQQRRLVDSMGAVLALNDYWGLIVRTSDGKPAASWQEERKSTLLHVLPLITRPELSTGEHFDRFVP